jgi:uncharacterized DUF497 family protein
MFERDDRLFLVVWTPRQTIVRMMSATKVTAKERKAVGNRL